MQVLEGAVVSVCDAFSSGGCGGLCGCFRGAFWDCDLEY